MELEPGSGSGTTRRQLLRGAGAFGIAAVAGGMLVACDDQPSEKSSQNAGPAQRGGDFVYAWPYQPGNVLSPGMPPGYTAGELYVQLQMFDRLTEVMPGSRVVKPGLATSWDVADSGKRWTFELRDAEFSNGMPVTAEDVKFSLERFADPNRNLYASLGQIIDRVRVRDLKTVEVTLKEPRGGFADVLSIVPASILPAQLVKKLGEKGFDQAPIGSGPYKYESRDKGRSLQLSRNDSYWRSGQPYLDSVRFDYVADPSARLLRVTNGDAHAATGVPFSQMRRLESANGVRVQVDEVASLAMVQLSERNKALTDPKVRRALNLAAPRDAMRASIFQGKVEVANSHVQKLRFWDSEVDPYPLDIDEAKRLLASSSVPDGFEMEILYVGNDAESGDVATVLQEAWAPLGIRVKQTQVDVGTMNERRADGDFDGLIAFDLLSDLPSEDQFGEFFYTPQPVPGAWGLAYKDPKAAALCRQALTASKDADRERLWSELQTYGMTVDGPSVPLFFLNQRSVVRDEVQGFRPTLVDTIRFEQVFLDEA